jgi:hypothetical protein
MGEFMKLAIAALITTLSLSAFAYDFTVKARHVAGSLTSGCAPAASSVVAMLQSRCNGRHAALENYDVKCARLYKQWEASGVGYCKSY